MLVPFLSGAVAVASVTAAVFFLRFWKETRDPFFLAFVAYFAIEALNRTARLFMEHPNEGSPWIYYVRLLASLVILAAILRKNYGKG